jgi:hypothetical protein
LNFLPKPQGQGALRVPAHGPRLVTHESGVTAIEYSLIAALIAVAAISALQNVDFVMPPDMVYQYPLWGVGLLLVGLVILGVVVFDLAAHQFLSVEFRRRHNDAAAALFSMMGVTFAVLLAFVAMLSWDGYK